VTGHDGTGDRERVADERDRLADDRDTHADQREHEQDVREAALDLRERAVRPTETLMAHGAEERLRQAQETIRTSREQLQRSWARLDRVESGLARDRTRRGRDQDDVDREVRKTARQSRQGRTVADRWRTLSATFQRRVDGVDPASWDLPSPCAGWVVLDVVAHMVEWMPALWFPAVGRPVPALPDVAVDPAATWGRLRTAVQELLDDRDARTRMTATRAGEMTLEQLVATTGLMDVLVHTWDLARATGQDERLDQAEVEAFLAGVEPMDESLGLSGHYGPRLPVAPDADAQTRLLAFTGRRP
jgi:uncharacterized protein (TIGR03086 family)